MIADNSGRPADWHALSREEALSRLEATPRGLSAQEAAKHLAGYGRNALPPPRKRGPLLRFLLQFHNVLIYVLLAAAAITALLGHWVDSGVILGVVVINAYIGFLQEGKAERALDAIRGMLSPHALALRDGRRHEIDAAELASGDRAPADLRLIEVKSLKIEEAARRP
jgi:magnesium-transporting ATPase (P-type)